DAFNGLALWRRAIESWGWREWSKIQFSGVMRFKGPDQIFRRLVAVGDTVYVTLGFREPVVALDGATGKTVRVYKGTEDAAEILYSNGFLLLARNAPGEAPAKNVLAVDAETGRVLWERKGYTGVTSRGDELKAYTDAYLTAGDDKVYFLDRDDVVALDMRSGEEAWKRPRPETKKGVFGHNSFNFAHFCSLVYHDGMLFLGQIHPTPTNLNRWQEKDMVILAMDAASGKELWRHTGMTLAHFTPPDLFVNNGMVWTMKKQVVSLCGLDARTGAVKKEYPVKGMLVGHHHRCYRNKATVNYYLAGEEGIEYIDFDSGELDVHHWLRGACAYGLMPANGLIYMPTHACGCHSNVKLNGFLALNSRDVAPGAAREPRGDGDRLEKGPAYGKTIAAGRRPSDAGTDWPVFKHDSARSNHVATGIPSELSKMWAKPLGGKLTPPVIADGKVFLAAPEGCRVHCLSAKTGEAVWELTTDGPVDTPPSFHAGRLVFGTRAGSVYAVTADAGELIWRFRAAPADLRLVASGRLESLWPVNGSVLVMDGKAYCVAGRSMHLDSGLYVYSLDVKTGEVLQRANLKADTGPKGELKGAVLPDILVSDGDNIYMRQMQFKIDDITEQGTARGGGFLRANDGGLLDDTWINHTFWRYMRAQAQMLVFDGKTAYGIKGCGKLINKSYGQDTFTPGGKGYQLYAVDTGARTGGGADAGKAARRGKRKRGGRSAARPKWTQHVRVRAQGMVLTNAHLFLAGAPDTVAKNDPWAAFDDRKGGVIEVRSIKDGKRLAEHTLDSSPVYDGLAAAGGRLFVTLRNGTVLCMGGKGR
ncbi:MAG: outer membrane protein assembly factor BamB family protein, partial [Planctomycetota bacterium]